MLGENIKELRMERGITQSQLAVAIGVTQGAVYFWEKEINEPTAGCLIKLAEFFGISVDELLSFESQKESGNSNLTAEMVGVFSRLSPKQRELIISLAKEMVK